eukprot:Phypoly_transcript_10602.p1 GENE.Phypoly_transcript_10602~~Phypoly_transcript_10602.p1  ORF type:complete len:335 (+),score=42.43 Phypoly_transcript_10602:92-1096(+)
MEPAKKRKKISNACAHCHQAKRKCEEQRPCARCIKKNAQCAPFVSTSSPQYDTTNNILTLNTSSDLNNAILSNNCQTNNTITSTNNVSTTTLLLNPVNNTLANNTPPLFTEISSHIFENNDIDSWFSNDSAYPLFTSNEISTVKLITKGDNSNASLDLHTNNPTTTNYAQNNSPNITNHPHTEDIKEERKKSAYALWDLQTHLLGACNFQFAKLVGYDMDTLSSNFYFSLLIPERYREESGTLWTLLSSLASVQKRLELKLCLLTKDGAEICVNTKAQPVNQHKVMMEYDLASLCDDKWAIDDFIHFPTFKVQPHQCRACNYNIYEIWRFMEQK